MKKNFKRQACLTTMLAVSMTVSPMLGSVAYGAAIPLTEGSWSQDTDGWRHRNSLGASNTGWILTESGWYYMSPETGLMLTGFQVIDGQGYYLESTGEGVEGRLYSGWKQMSDGTWRFFHTAQDGNFGKMESGWQWIDGYCYYFEPAVGEDQGKLYTNGKTPDGYWVDKDGRWTDEQGMVYFERGKGLTSKEQLEDASSTGSLSGGTSRGSSGSGGTNGSSEHKKTPQTSGGSSSGEVGGAEQPEQNHPEAERPEPNQPEPNQPEPNRPEPNLPTEQVINENRSGLVDLGWVQYAVIAFSEGSRDDYRLTIDGTDITEACTNVDDDGTIVKWQTTVWNPGAITVTRASDGNQQTLKLGTGADQVKEAGDSASAPAYVLTNGPISVFDYHLDNYDKDGRVRVRPEKTTFDLSDRTSGSSEEIPTDHYVPETPVDADGNAKLQVKLALKTEEQNEWFRQLKKIKAMNGENNIVNSDLIFSTEITGDHGTTGVITINLPQSNLYSRGRYQLNLVSSYSGDTVNVPVHLVDSRTYEMKLNALNPNPKTGEDFAFDIAGTKGESFGTEILSPIYRVDLTMPSGIVKTLTKFDQWYEIGSLLHICGTEENGEGAVITDEAGIYTVTVYADGYQTMSKKLEIRAGEARAEAVRNETVRNGAVRGGEAGNRENRNVEKTVSLKKSRAARPVLADAVSTASLVIPGDGSDSSGSGSGGSMMNGWLVFDHDLLANAQILHELDAGCPYSEAVMQWWYDQTPEAVMNEQAAVFYDYVHYLNQVKDAKMEQGRYLTFAAYQEVQQGGETAGAAQIKRVLEDGKLGTTESMTTVIGKDAPLLNGTENALGENLTLTAQGDSAYISSIQALYLDGHSEKLRNDDYLSQYEISDAKDRLTIFSTAKGQAPSLQLTAGEHRLRIVAAGYKDTTIVLQVTKQQEDFVLALADNPLQEAGEAADRYYVGQEVILTAAAAEGEPQRGDFLKELTVVQLTGPDGKIRQVLPYGAGSIAGEDSYKKQDSAVVLQKNLFRTAGTYQVLLKAGGYPAKTLEFEIFEGKENTDSDLKQAPVWEKTEIVKERGIFGNYQYYRVSFDEEVPGELNDYLSQENLERVIVDGTPYEKALLGIRADDKDVYYVRRVNGDIRYLELKPEDDLEAEDHEVVISSKGYEDVLFTLEAAGSVNPENMKEPEIPEKPEISEGTEIPAEPETPKGPETPTEPELPGTEEERKQPPEFESAKEITTGGLIWDPISYCSITFGGAEEKEIERYLEEKSLKVMAGDQLLERAGSISSASSGRYVIGWNSSGTRKTTLQILMEDVTEGDTIVLMADGYEDLEFDLFFTETLSSEALMETDEIEEAQETVTE